MSRRVMELTPAQELALEQHIEHWRELVTTVRPTDRAVAERALRQLYSDQGLGQPTIKWFSSPEETVCVAEQAQSAGPLVWHSIGGLLGERVWRVLWMHVAASVGWDVWKKMKGTLWTSVTRCGYTGEFRWADKPYNKLPSSLEESKQVVTVTGDEQVEFLSCKALASWPGRTGERFTDELWVSELLPTLSFFNEVIGVEELGEVGPLIRLAESAGPWVARERSVFVCDRPTHFSLDERGLLHCEDGPALGYPSGQALYSWHGIRVEDRVILAPETISVDEICEETNAEVRRVLIERYGLDRFVSSNGAILVDSSRFGKLWRWQKDHFGVAGVRWLELKNSTREPDGSRKTYFLRVPSKMNTAHEATAWTFGMTPDGYSIAAES